MNVHTLRTHVGVVLVAMTFSMLARSGQDLETMSEEQLQKVDVYEAYKKAMGNTAAQKLDIDKLLTIRNR